MTILTLSGSGLRTAFVALVVLSVLLSSMNCSDAARTRQTKKMMAKRHIVEELVATNSTAATLPGIQITLSNQLLAFLSQVIPAFTPKELPLPPTTQVVHNVTVSVSNLELQDISLGKPSATFTSGLLIETTEMGADVVGMDWSYDSKFLSDEGTANITLSDITLSLLLGVNETHGNPQLVPETSDLDIQTLDLSFHGNIGWIYNVLSSYLSGIIKNELGGQLPVALGAINKILLDLPMVQTLYKIPTPMNLSVVLDYHLTSPANFFNGLMTIGLQGLVYLDPIGYNYPTDIQPVVMPSNATGSAAQIFISDFVAGSALVNLFPVYRTFHLSSILPTNSCNTETTTLFNPSICTLNPNSTLQYDIAFNSPPTWKTTNNSNAPILLSTNTTILVMVITNDDPTNVTQALSFDLQLDITFELNINSTTFSASVVSSSATATILESSIGSVFFLGFKINSAVTLSKGLIDERLVFNIQDAITKKYGIGLVDPTVGYGNGYFYISTDVTLL